jgi:N-methylhydantoinase B
VIAGGAEPVWLTVWRGRRQGSGEPFTFTLFNCGGTGARATKDGLSTTGFPSGVAGVPAEVIETLSPLVQYRRELRTDSGGPGRCRGGLGQTIEMGCRTDQPWSVSALIDRTLFAGAGLAGGSPGALGEFRLSDGTRPQPKSVVSLQPGQRVFLRAAGGGGYGRPQERPIEAVLDDVVNGYVSLEAARRDYGVVIEYTGGDDRLVRGPRQYRVDREATEELRRQTAST